MREREREAEVRWGIQSVRRDNGGRDENETREGGVCVFRPIYRGDTPPILRGETDVYDTLQCMWSCQPGAVNRGEGRGATQGRGAGHIG